MIQSTLKQRKRAQKAQLFSLDMIITVGLLLLLVSVVGIYWNYNVREINKRQTRIELQRAIYDSTNYLIKVKLVNKTNILDTSKLLDFAQCDYNSTKAEIGLEGYEFLFNLTYSGGEQVYINGTPIYCGEDYSNATELMVVKRACVWNNTFVIGVMYIWTW